MLMGYYMTQRSSNFTIKKSKFDDALKAIKKLLNNSKQMSGGSSTGERWFSWVETTAFLNAKTLPDALMAWRWKATVSEKTGNIIDLFFIGEKIGDDEVLFNALAPFVERGSYIEMEGEDGNYWKWVFNKKLTSLEGKVVYS